jgi:hypothetical protein
MRADVSETRITTIFRIAEKGTSMQQVTRHGIVSQKITFITIAVGTSNLSN